MKPDNARTQSLCWVACLLILIAVSACDKADEAASSKTHLTTLAGDTVKRQHDAVKVAQGDELFARNCAACHGAAAEGAVDWRRPDAAGFYPPPPLNGTGHAWHHPRRNLHDMIKYGSGLDEQGRLTGKMPAWQGKLTDAEIDAIIEWFQSLWPDQVYAIWYDRQRWNK